MRRDPDLFGRALLDWSRGGTYPEYIQRADGLTVPAAGHEFYLAPFRNWPSSEQASLRYARGRVVDIGSGAGRVSLHLQECGRDVVALDASPRAIRSARLRGVKDAWHMSARQISGEIGAFDTIILFGNNFGMFGTPERVSRVLTSWARRTHAGARILAESTTPYCGGAPAILSAQQNTWPNAGPNPNPNSLSRFCRSVVRLVVCISPRNASTCSRNRLEGAHHIWESA
jgi:SAM-dependent methyltransferase